MFKLLGLDTIQKISPKTSEQMRVQKLTRQTWNEKTNGSLPSRLINPRPTTPLLQRLSSIPLSFSLLAAFLQATDNGGGSTQLLVVF